MTAIPHLDAASAGARSDTRSDTYGRGFRRGDSVIHREQAYLSPESLRDSAYALRHVHNPTRARLRNFESKLLYPSVKPPTPPAPSLVACMALGRSECPILLPPPTPPPPSLLVGGGLTPPAAWRRGTGRGGPVSMRTREKKTILKSPQGGRYQARDDIQNHCWPGK